MKTSALAFKPEYLGFAAVVATLPLYEPALHSFHTIAPETFDTQALPFSWAALISALIAALALGFLPALREKAFATPRSTPYRVAMSIGSLLGTAGLCLLAGPGLPLPIALLLGAVGGVGSALLLVAWGYLLCSATYQTALAHLAGAGVLSAFLMNTVGTLPYPLACVLFGAFELVALGVPWICRPQTSGGAPESSQPKDSALPTVVGGIALFGLSFMLLGNHTVPYFYLSFLIGAIVAGAATVPFVLIRAKRSPSTLLQTVVLPLVGFSAVGIAIAVPHSTVSRTAFAAFYSFAIVVLLVAVISLAKHADQRPTQVFGAAIGTYAGASIAGLILRTILPIERCSLIFTILTLGYLAYATVRPALAAWLAGPTAAAPSSVPVTPHTLTTVEAAYHLTERETEILRLLAEGATSSAIAEALVISNSTARGHAHKIYQKLGVSTKEELIEFLARAQDNGEA